MTLLVASLAFENLGELEVRAERAWREGAEAVELRIDLYGGDPAELAAYLETHRGRTWIITCRSAKEGGFHQGDATERIAMLLAVACGTNAYVDVELADWPRSSDARRELCDTLAAANLPERGFILSAHDPIDLPGTLSALIEETATEHDVAAGKLAYAVDHIADSFHALDWMREHGDAIAAMAVGDDGAWTRVLSKKLGAFAAYCSLDHESATAPGQLTLCELIDRYRWREIDASTRVFGVIGDPVAHSMSPLLFNYWFAQSGINAVYLPLHVRGDDRDAVQRFLDGCRERPWLDIDGLSVTIPHKTSAMSWLGDRTDHMARGIGAVNTLSFRGRKTQGFNTDCYAALSSLTDALGCERDDLFGLSVDVLGTGGAARALLYGLPMFGCDVKVYGRSPETVRSLAGEFEVHPAAWDKRTVGRGDVLINATSVGLWPDVDVSPMPPEALAGRRLVFDVIYNPPETKLLRDARAAGVETLSGLDMFVRQAAMQFVLWTGRCPDEPTGRDLIMREIERQGSSS